MSDFYKVRFARHEKGTSPGRYEIIDPGWPTADDRVHTSFGPIPESFGFDNDPLLSEFEVHVGRHDVGSRYPNIFNRDRVDFICLCRQVARKSSLFGLDVDPSERIDRLEIKLVSNNDPEDGFIAVVGFPLKSGYSFGIPDKIGDSMWIEKLADLDCDYADLQFGEYPTKFLVSSAVASVLFHFRLSCKEETCVEGTKTQRCAIASLGGYINENLRKYHQIEFSSPRF